MSLPTLNRRQTSVRQQRWRHLLLPLLTTVLALASLGTSAPATENLYSEFDWRQELNTSSTTWMSPCGTNISEAKISNPTGSNKSTKFHQDMKRLINLTLLDLNNWRDLTASNNSVTIWNDTHRKRQFRFLQPFVKNVSSWERRLSVYWAYLKLVRQYHQKYPESTNIKREEVVALESVNEASKELLCTVQEYRQVTKRQKKQISVEQMQKMVNFTIHDAGEIKIHIWYIMCRLECFLKNMRKHLRQLSAKGNQAYKPVNMMNCKTCPYCKACPYCKPKKQCQQHNKKHRKQTQHQQQQQRQHNRAGHSAQQKQANQHQQPSRQPKGRKGTQQPNNHARNKQG